MDSPRQPIDSLTTMDNQYLYPQYQRIHPKSTQLRSIYHRELTDITRLHNNRRKLHPYTILHFPYHTSHQSYSSPKYPYVNE